MSIKQTVYELLGSCLYSKYCFDYSEEEARSRGLWRDPKPMPDINSEQWINAALIAAKRGQKEIIKEAFENEMIRGSYHSEILDFTVDNRRYGINNDRDSIKDLIDAQVSSTTFYGINETSMVLTRPQLIALGSEMRDDLLSKRQRKFTRIESINSATTVSEVDNIIW